ncbi:hypothetical protein [Yersinia phage fHe-Yen9-04]|uniref:Uncharacterized protein n=2 Tax=Eneladusvirus Yen904 TaxID=2560849 RepID=A0A2C9CYB8_9CAUD|nr:membrane protein [Yersinia phage fHe-Yen9-04]SOK58796.1 hypothetical protein [Yersinia phage fHe-Yen9-04]SOK59334.1 hypothetical protein [Yersinia phage fHe-Yen9-03]VUE36565.1 hypothetical protein [Yersinia phage fHe-Yen9-04]
MNEIFLIASYVNVSIWLIVLIVMFIGFWTYADYYTNMDKFTSLFILVAGALKFIFGAIIFSAAYSIDNDLKHSIDVTVYLVSIISSVIYAFILFVIIILFFIHSRQYFGRKRNKL